MRIPGLGILLYIVFGAVCLFLVFANGVDRTPIGELPLWYWLVLLLLLVILVPLGVFRAVAIISDGISTVGMVALSRAIFAVGWLVVGLVVGLWTSYKGGLLALFGTLSLANLIVVLLCMRQLWLRR